MPAWLVETSGDHQGRVHDLEPGPPITIGRSPENTIVVPNANASRRHAQLTHENDAWRIEDLGTKNGTLRNGRGVSGAESLEEGDEIVVPGLTLVYHASEDTMIVSYRPAAPSATKSFLFSDLRGYTAFTELYGDQAANEVVTEYRLLVRAEIKRTAGHEVKTEGDSFFVVFESARSALDCALGIQRLTAEHTARQPHRPIRVGIGVHTGEPIVEHGDYIGLAVNIASRLASNAEPGQTVISEIVRALLPSTDLPPMTEREGLKLKGIDQPPRAYVIEPPGPAAPTPTG